MFPYFDNIPGVLRIVIPVVEKHMAEPCAYYSAKYHIYKQCAYPLFGHAFVLEDAVHYLISYPETYRKSQSIPSDGDKAVDEIGISRPRDKIKHNFYL